MYDVLSFSVGSEEEGSEEELSDLRKKGTWGWWLLSVGPINLLPSGKTPVQIGKARRIEHCR